MMSPQLHRYCRLVHGWLSAFAFLLLCFFALTGLTLNHPEWSVGAAPAPIEKRLSLSADEIEQLRLADEPGEELVRIAGAKITLRGEYSASELVGPDVFVRMQGVRGLTDLRANLDTGALEAVIEPAPVVALLNELHRAERAGSSWRLLVDAFAVLLIALCVAGYLIFLSLRFRLRTALLLTAGSALSAWSVFMLAVR